MEERQADQEVDHSAVWAAWENEPGRWRREIDHQIFGKLRFYNLLLEEICSCPRQPARVLEVGCGSGIDSYYLAERSGAEHVGLDVADTSIDLGRKLGRFFSSTVEYVQGDARRMEFEDESFDLVFSQGFLEHFADPVPLIEEQLRVLAPWGSLVIDVPQRYSLYTLIKHHKMRRGTWRWGWEREFSAGEMRRLADNHPTMELKGLGSWGYDFYSEILRRPFTKAQRRNPYRHTAWSRRIERWHDRSIGRALEAAWGAIERPFGPHFMMNVTGVYRKAGPRATSGPSGPVDGVAGEDGAEESEFFARAS
jgi:SAM-dependent methyltransferase